MHPNRAFRTAPEARNLAFARGRAFGVLAVNDTGGPRLSHVPFLLSEDGALAEAHLVRSNPVLPLLATPQPAVIAVSGPDGYISPDWYDSANQVPTWNYVAVHLHGVLERRPQGELRDLLVRQSAAYEARLAPKPPWLIDKMDAGALERMLRAIVPVRLRIEAVEGTWKLSQNKGDIDRRGAADAVETGFGQELSDLSALMREPDDPARN